MRFPLRLSAALAKSNWTRIFRGKNATPGILRLDVARKIQETGVRTSGPSETKSDEEILSEVQASSAPVIWFGGAEPLLHPAIGKLARTIADSGRFVFVETDGRLLRRRIHEFRPESRTFLTLRFDVPAKREELDAGEEPTHLLALEGIRAAKLSGFLICAHVTLGANASVEELARLQSHLQKLGVDGFVVTAENASYEKAQKELDGAWSILGNGSWRAFSRLAASVLSGERDRKQDAQDREREMDEEMESSEEGVEVS